MIKGGQISRNKKQAPANIQCIHCGVFLEGDAFVAASVKATLALLDALRKEYMARKLEKQHNIKGSLPRAEINVNSSNAFVMNLLERKLTCFIFDFCISPT